MLVASLKNRLVKPLQENEKLLILCAAEFIFMMGMGVVSPVLPRFAQSFGIGAAMVGLVVSIFGFARLLLNAPAGLLSQRYGRRTLLVSGAIISAIGAFLSGVAPSFWLLLLFRFLQGAGSAMFTTTAMAFLADISTPANRGRIMSVYQGSLLLGTSVGPVVGGFVAALLDLRSPFFLVAVLSFACAFWVHLRLPETVTKLSSSSSAQSKQDRQENGRALGSWSILGNGNFLLISLVTFGIFFTRTGAQQTVVPLMAYDTLGIGPAEVGFAMTVLSIFNFISVPLSGMAADRLGRKAAIVPGCLLAAVGLLAFLGSANYALFLLAAAIHGFGTGLGGPAPAAYAADLAPRGLVGQTMGLYRTLADVGFVLGPPILGWIADSAGFGWSIGFNSILLIGGPLLFAVFAQETVSRRAAARELNTGS